MNEKQFEELKQHVASTIKVTVNGKVDRLHNKLDDYIKEDMEWKVRAEPVVKAFENTSWLFRLFVTALKLAGLVGAGIAAFTAFRQFLNK